MVEQLSHKYGPDIEKRQLLLSISTSIPMTIIGFWCFWCGEQRLLQYSTKDIVKKYQQLH